MRPDPWEATTRALAPDHRTRVPELMDALAESVAAAKAARRRHRTTARPIPQDFSIADVVEAFSRWLNEEGSADADQS
jgi:hypothetical protein